MRIEGLEEVVAAFAGASLGTPARVRPIVRKHTDDMTNTAKALAPIRDGELREGIEPRYERGGLTGAAESTADHGVFMEYGTYKDAPQAHMGPAHDRHSGDFVRDMEEIVDL